MKNFDLIDAAATCDILGIKPQTLYAYVSRGYLRAEADAADARCSLYRRSEVEELARQRRRPRARAEVAEQAIRWGEPILTSGITEVRDGMLWLRGKSVAECAQQFTLERMASHLWGTDQVDFVGVDQVTNSPKPVARALQSLARQVSDASPIGDLSPKTIAEEGARLVSIVTNALLDVPAKGFIHHRLGQAWSVGASGLENLRRALVVLSDHELNPSTFAVRIAISTGASLPAALLSGLATLSGPLHGGATSMACLALRATLDGKVDDFFVRYGDVPPYHFGFGHPLYPDGDPRARLLLDHLGKHEMIAEALDSLSCKLDLQPNIDAALAALTIAEKLPDTAAFTIFAAGRLVGWIAHAIEQKESGEIIRPRARYSKRT